MNDLFEQKISEDQLRITINFMQCLEDCLHNRIKEIEQQIPDLRKFLRDNERRLISLMTVRFKTDQLVIDTKLEIKEDRADLTNALSRISKYQTLLDSCAFVQKEIDIVREQLKYSKISSPNLHIDSSIIGYVKETKLERMSSDMIKTVQKILTIIRDYHQAKIHSATSKKHYNLIINMSKSRKLDK